MTTEDTVYTAVSASCLRSTHPSSLENEQIWVWKSSHSWQYDQTALAISHRIKKEAKKGGNLHLLQIRREAHM